MGTGYIPEGSYMVQNEQFRNETIWAAGVDINNYTASDGVSMWEDDGRSWSAPDRLKMKINGPSQEATHNSMANCNTFINEISFLFKSDDFYMYSQLTFAILDKSHNILAEIKINHSGAGMRITYDDPTYNLMASNEILTYEEWHEIKVYIHSSNSPHNGRMELLVDGYKLWWDGGGLENSNLYELSAQGDTSEGIGYHSFSTDDVEEGQIWDIRSVLTKDWCDFENEVKGNSEYVQAGIQTNDKATYIKLREFNPNTRVTQKMNEMHSATVSIVKSEVLPILENILVDEADGNKNHISFDNRAYVFLQQSKLMSYGYKAETTINTNKLTDIKAEFVTNGIQVGDKIWFFREGLVIGNPYSVQNVLSETELEIDGGFPTGSDDTDCSYLISRGSERTGCRALGDYIFQGRLKQYNIVYSDGEQKLNIELDGILDIAKNKLLYNDSTRFYKQAFDYILLGYYVDPPALIVDGVYRLGNFRGILHGPPDGMPSTPSGKYFRGQAFIAQFINVSEETREEQVISKIWNTSTYFFDAIASLAETTHTQFYPYCDYEHRNERVLLMRDKKNFETDAPILRFYTGNNYPYGGVGESEVRRSMKALNYIKSNRGYQDRILLKGANDDQGVLYVDDEADSMMDSYDGFTKESEMANNKMRYLTLVEGLVEGEFEKSRLILPEGQIDIEPVSLFDTWFEDIYTNDSTSQLTYGRIESTKTGSYAGYITGDSTWFYRTLNGDRTRFEKDRTSQAHVYRKPFSVIGEIGELVVTGAKSFKFQIFEYTFQHSSKGASVLIRPWMQPWDLTEMLTNTRREIDWVAENFRDPEVAYCELEPICKDWGQMEESVQLGLSSQEHTLQTFHLHPGIAQVVWHPFLLQDYSNTADTAYAYQVYYLNMPAGLWNVMPIKDTGLFVDDLDLSALPEIGLNTDMVNMQYGMSIGNNYMNLDANGPGGPGNGTYDIMIVLTCRHEFSDYSQDIPRTTSGITQDVKQKEGTEMVVDWGHLYATGDIYEWSLIRSHIITGVDFS